MSDLPLFGTEPLPMFGEPMPFAGRTEMLPYQPNFSAIEKKLQRRNVPSSIVTNPPRIPGERFAQFGPFPYGRPLASERVSSLPKKPFKIPGEQYGEFIAPGLPMSQRGKATPRSSSLKDKRPTIKKSPRGKKSLGMFGATSPKSR
jgi:hypothetical protein